MKGKIAFYSSNGFAETFTKAHIDLLDVEYRITGGTPPKFVNDKFMLPMNKFSLMWRKLAGLFTSKYTQADFPLFYFLKKNRPAVLVAEFGTAGAAVVNACKENKIPLIVNFYGIDAFGYAVLEKNKTSYLEMFQYASCFGVQSYSIKKQLIKLGCEADKIIVNSCPPDPSFFSLEPTFEKPVLIAVGRFVEKKAPHLTIAAFEKVVKKIPDAKLIMAGDGPLLEEAEYLVETSGLRGKVVFLGRINPEEQRKQYEKAFVFVQHSVIANDGDAEGLPVSIMEASAAGLPVVSTLHSGIPEAVLNNESGILVHEFDTDAMAEAIVKILSDKNLAIRMGQKGKKFMSEKFTMQNHIAVLKNMINTVIESR